MEQKLIELLDRSLRCEECKIKTDKIVIKVYSNKQSVSCPYCKKESTRVHSVYQREIQDIPLHNKQTILLLSTRKMFCDNQKCTHRTFSERFDFVAPSSKKTKRLIDKILITSTKLSSINASSLLKNDSIQVCKSSICDLLKKNASDCG